MYPTKEEILATRPKFKKGILKAVKEWKKTEFEGWRDFSLESKWEKLRILTSTLSLIEGMALPSIVEDIYYFQHENEIHVDWSSPSLISTLHELGHYFLGSSELEACQFSVWLFKECFPKAFEKLVWDGHMLKRA